MKKIKIALSFKLLALLVMSFVILSGVEGYAQFTTDRDTLVIVSGDSCTYYYEDGDTTAGYDLNGKILVGVDFDSTSAWTAATFSIYTSATYNEDADTSGGSPYDWKLVNYDGTAYTLTPETGAINYLNLDKVRGLKRYIRFVGNEAEAAPRKLIPLIRSGL